MTHPNAEMVQVFDILLDAELNDHDLQKNILEMAEKLSSGADEGQNLWAGISNSQRSSVYELAVDERLDTARLLAQLKDRHDERWSKQGNAGLFSRIEQDIESFTHKAERILHRIDENMKTMAKQGMPEERTVKAARQEMVRRRLARIYLAAAVRFCQVVMEDEER